MVTFHSTNGHEIKVDRDDYEVVKNYSWWVGKKGTTYYADARMKGFPGCPRVFLHRLIMRAFKGQLIDHINGDGLDCRKENMRFATKQQNNYNRKIRSDNSSGFIGVRRLKNCKSERYAASLMLNGKHIHLGCFGDKVSAAKAYNDGAIKHFGSFAKLNDIKEGNI